MKTNINIDNYEAYLLDYLEGNLSPDKAEQLKAFVAAQGMDWEELTEELPYLEAPAVAHPDKESLKKKGTLMPLYVKIASAAAAAGLLLTVTLWPEKQLPKTDPIVQQKPPLSEQLITSNETEVIPPDTIQVTQPKAVVKIKPIVQEKVEMPLLAELKLRKPQPIPTSPLVEELEANLLAHRVPTNFDLAQFGENQVSEDIEDERELTHIGRGIYRLTNGRHDSFGSIISSGISTAKKEISLAATDLALTTYYRADERFEEARERWEEKREE